MVRGFILQTEVEVSATNQFTSEVSDDRNKCQGMFKLDRDRATLLRTKDSPLTVEAEDDVVSETNGDKGNITLMMKFFKRKSSLNI